MGSCNIKIEKQEVIQPVNINFFTMNYPIGRGGFGKVWDVTQEKTKQKFAMKEMLKGRVIAKKSVESVLNEQRLLSSLKHPFIVNMHYAFQDRDKLYLVMDLLTGGDLRYHMSKKWTFTEEQTIFFVACIVTGLEYLHHNNIIHRDIKPENLVLDSSGYLRITDLGIARYFKSENSKETSGTPGYMAPEVLCRQNHSFVADFFAVGVITYELIMGKRPYLGRNRREIRDAVIARQVQIRSSEVPLEWSLEAVDFANKLIQRKASKRLGYNGIQELKNHPWLKNFPWTKLHARKLGAPFVPGTSENFDNNQVSREWNDELSADAEKGFDQVFNGYFYDVRFQSEFDSD